MSTSMTDMMMSSLCMNEAERMPSLSVKRDMMGYLVPTTIAEQDLDDIGYHSDDKGFYQLDVKEEEAANSSGASTPERLALDDAAMDSFALHCALMPMSSSGGLSTNSSNCPSHTSEDLSAATMPSQAATQNSQDLIDFLRSGFSSTDNASNCYKSITTERCGYPTSDVSESSDEDELNESGDQLEILDRPVKGMTSEEKKQRRRALNRLAARRSRQKKRVTSSTLKQDAERLTKRNAELKVELTLLESAKTELYNLIKNYFKPGQDNNNNINHDHGAAPAEACCVPETGAPAVACCTPPCPVPGPVTCVQSADVGYSGTADAYQGPHD